MIAGHIPTIAAIVADAVAVSDVSVDDVMGASRATPVARMRFAIAWAAKRSTGHSLPVIGRALGGRDHCTIANALARAERLRASDPLFRQLSTRLADLADMRRELADALATSDFASPQVRDRCRLYMGQLLAPVRAVCRDGGYLLTVHGDAGAMGLIAIPWEENPLPPHELAEQVMSTCRSIIGSAFHRIEDGAVPQAAPHGRLVWPIHLGGDVCIHLSVLPGNKGGDNDEH